jgi:hypothetical protein
MIGGTLMQTLILAWVTFRTDWDKEVRAVTLHLRYHILLLFLLSAHLNYTIVLIIPLGKCCTHVHYMSDIQCLSTRV